jgi:hypothetical protein
VFINIKKEQWHDPNLRNLYKFRISKLSCLHILPILMRLKIAHSGYLLTRTISINSFIVYLFLIYYCIYCNLSLHDLWKKLICKAMYKPHHWTKNELWFLSEKLPSPHVSQKNFIFVGWTTFGNRVFYASQHRRGRGRERLRKNQTNKRIKEPSYIYIAILFIQYSSSSILL